MTTKDSDEEFIATVTLIVADIARSVAFYRDILGASVLQEGEPTCMRLKNVWIIINKGRRSDGRQAGGFRVSARRPQHVELLC